MSGDESDDDLLARCRAGDDAAWAQLVQRYECLVYSTALRLGLSRQDAADVFQQVWVEVYRSIFRIQSTPALTRWLIRTTGRIAYRQAILSKRWIRDVLDDIVDPSEGALAAIDGFELLQRLESALTRLGGRCEQLLRALFLSRPAPPYTEVARRLRIGVNSVGPIRNRCLTRMRSLMEESS